MSEPKRTLRIDATTGEVVNAEMWSALPEEEGFLFVFSDEAAIGWTYADGVFSPPPEPAPAIPDEVAMHRALKAMYLTPWPGSANLEEAVYAAIETLPEPQRGLALREINRAPNLQRLGVTTTNIKTLIGMSDAQRDELMVFAASLP